MANCKDCIHNDVCIYRSHEEYKTIQDLKNDCPECIPTADVAEVVRCKDCKHRYVPTRCALWTGTIGEKDYFCYHGDDFYCSFGEREE